MKTGTLFLLSLALLSTAVPAQEKTLSSHDFAYGIPLEVDGDGAIYSLPLPEEVYRFSTRRDLGDMRRGGAAHAAARCLPEGGDTRSGGSAFFPALSR